MSTPPTRPKFITNITWFQKTLAGVSGSSFLMVCLTLIPWIAHAVFDGDALFVSELRKWMAVLAFVAGCFVGIPQIKYLISYAFDIMEFYQKFLEFKKKTDKE